MRIKDLYSFFDSLDGYELGRQVRGLLLKLKPYCVAIGKKAALPLVELYCVLTADTTSMKDRLLILASLLYIVMPGSILPARIFSFLGVMDEGAALLFVLERMRKLVTPDIRLRAMDILNGWFKEKPAEVWIKPE